LPVISTLTRASRALFELRTAGLPELPLISTSRRVVRRVSGPVQTVSVPVKKQVSTARLWMAPLRLPAMRPPLTVSVPASR
jgi:hypothetical protein